MGIDAHLQARTRRLDTAPEQVCEEFESAFGSELEVVDSDMFVSGSLASGQYVDRWNGEGVVRFRDHSYPRLYERHYERGPWGTVALKIWWLWERLPRCQLLYCRDDAHLVPISDIDLVGTTRHWVLWGNKSYLDSGFEPPDDYHFGAPPDYPWYSLAYHICKEDGCDGVADWRLLPEPEPLSEHPNVVREVLSWSAVDTHEEAVARACDKPITTSAKQKSAWL